MLADAESGELDPPRRVLECAGANRLLLVVLLPYGPLTRRSRRPRPSVSCPGLSVGKSASRVLRPSVKKSLLAPVFARCRVGGCSVPDRGARRATFLLSMRGFRVCVCEAWHGLFSWLWPGRVRDASPCCHTYPYKSLDVRLGHPQFIAPYHLLGGVPRSLWWICVLRFASTRCTDSAAFYVISPSSNLCWQSWSRPEPAPMFDHRCRRPRSAFLRRRSRTEMPAT